MAVYVIADIHGEKALFDRMLEKIYFNENDTLYVLGDIIDRGPEPIPLLLRLMELPNAVPILGNHELMALPCLRFLMREITEESIAQADDEIIESLLCWQQNGCAATLEQFARLDEERRQAVIEYIEDMYLFEQTEAGGRRYLLVHAGLGGFEKDRELTDYSPDELVWERSDPDERYFDGVFTVMGHTPTQFFTDDPRSGYIIRRNGNILIDCGACFRGGRLACLCLDTDEEFYVEREEA